MLKYVILLFTSLSATTIYAQDSTIHLEEKSNKPFIVNNKAYTFNERELIFKNQEALNLLNSAKSKFTGSQILAGFGGGFLGYSLTDLLLAKREKFTEEQWDNKKKTRAILIGGGVALVAIAIPISKSGINKVKSAVELENNSFAKEDSNNLSLNIKAKKNGFGLVLTF